MRTVAWAIVPALEGAVLVWGPMGATVAGVTEVVAGVAIPVELIEGVAG